MLQLTIGRNLPTKVTAYFSIFVRFRRKLTLNQKLKVEHHRNPNKKQHIRFSSNNLQALFFECFRTRVRSNRDWLGPRWLCRCNKGRSTWSQSVVHRKKRYSRWHVFERWLHTFEGFTAQFSSLSRSLSWRTSKKRN